MSLPHFPPGFRFGVATSAFQIEGAAALDGKGPSIWDTFTAEPGRVRHGEDARVAIDHYHRYAEDVTHIAELGAHDYRFSISWPRVVPLGRGPVNQRGLDFYDRLVDGLLTAGVRPVPTLYHWDLPQSLEDAGGWLVRDTAHALADYAAVVAERLGDRVRDWITMNEMNVQTLYGYALTDHAPARGLGLAALPAAHHQLLAHGLAVQALRAYGATSVGVATQHFPVTPATDDPADVAAAAQFSALTNWTFADPILRGDYPDETLRAGTGVPSSTLDSDLTLIGAPLDFYGVNYYEPVSVEAPRAGKDYRGVLEVDIPAGLPFSPVRVESAERTDFGWPIVPSGLTAILRTLHNRYPNLPPLVITENGASFHDTPADRLPEDNPLPGRFSPGRSSPDAAIDSPPGAAGSVSARPSPGAAGTVAGGFSSSGATDSAAGGASSHGAPGSVAGGAFEGTSGGGVVHDPRRIAYLEGHLRAVADAIAQGVDVRGYYVWSALDNFEWAAGYEERFGLVHVDRDTLARTRKDSWYWLRDLIAQLAPAPAP